MSHRGEPKKKPISERTALTTAGSLIVVAVVLALIAIYLAH